MGGLRGNSQLTTSFESVVVTTFWWNVIIGTKFLGEHMRRRHPFVKFKEQCPFTKRLDFRIKVFEQSDGKQKALRISQKKRQITLSSSVSLML